MGEEGEEEEGRERWEKWKRQGNTSVNKLYKTKAIKQTS
jgi:hypothetical protein